jgi:23S rRNA (cytidine1920-2'-O)/16S rRNA (cytidine1409-2'-O)-methyltransferase
VASLLLQSTADARSRYGVFRFSLYAVASAKHRADLLLVERGLASSRERARALILAGKVFSGTQRIDKAGAQLPADAELSVRGEDHPYVSRGGVKLQGALAAFALDPTAVVAADFGASTGGFSDCLLQAGAARVYAIDVGRAQLHDKLRRDPRVVVMERVNARHLRAGDLPEPLDWVVIDASFIGLDKLLPAAHALLQPCGTLVALCKPQFEVGRERVGKGGVVRDAEVRAGAIAGVRARAEELGFAVLGEADSVLPGPAGNRECFLYLRKR